MKRDYERGIMEMAFKLSHLREGEMRPILIPTYKRCELATTIECLVGKIPREFLVVAVQDEGDYESYTKKYKNDITLIYRKGEGVSYNRNTLLRYCLRKGYRRALMLDDDIQVIFVGYPHTAVRQNAKQIMSRQVRRLFSIGDALSHHGVLLWGGNRWAVPFLYRDRIATNLFTGSIMGFEKIQEGVMFDEGLPYGEDYEIQLRLVKENIDSVKKVYFLGCDKNPKGDPGGCSSIRDGAKYPPDALMWISEKYKELGVRVKSKNGGNVLTLRQSGTIFHVNDLLNI